MGKAGRVSAWTKLVDYTASGIGAIAGPMLANWKADREGQARVTAAKADAQVRLIEAESLSLISEAQDKARRVLERSSDTSQTRLEITGGDITHAIEFQTRKRLSNTKAVVEMAAEELGDEEVPEQEPNHDWTARYFDFAQDVSLPDMQMLWARVLTGEVRRPGSISLRSLNVLRHMDQSTAHLFQTLCSASISIRILNYPSAHAMVCSLGGRAGQNSLASHGLKFARLNVLNEHGLIIGSYNSRWDYKMCRVQRVPTANSRFASPMVFQGKYWVLLSTVQCDLSSDLMLSGVAFTRAGLELARVVETLPMPRYAQQLEEYLESLNLRMTEIDPGILYG